MRLELFNRYRALIQKSTVESINQQSFVETIKPFLSFYKHLPPYTQNTKRLASATLRLRNAIANADGAFIAQASGVGKKSAERVVVDLSDKVGLALRTNNDVFGNSSIIAGNDEALEALMALGYTLNDATVALEGVSTDLSTAERVTQALKG